MNPNLNRLGAPFFPSIAPRLPSALRALLSEASDRRRALAHDDRAVCSDGPARLNGLFEQAVSGQIELIARS